MERGWDPEVTKMFRKILNSVSFGLIWMMACVTAGIYFELAFIGGKPIIYNIIFYVCAVAGLVLLLRYLIRTWKK